MPASFARAVFLLLASLLAAPWRVLAQAPTDVPTEGLAATDLPTIAALNGFVYDPSGALGSYYGAVDARTKALADEAIAQLGVYVVPTIGDAVPKDFATALFGHLGLGGRGTDYGVLVLLVLDRRRAEIETGYGAEAYLTDALSRRLLERAFVPRARAGDVGGGIDALTAEIDGLMRRRLAGEDPIFLEAPPEPWRLPGWLAAYLLINGLFHVLLFAFLAYVYRDKVSYYDKYLRVRRAYSYWYAVPFPLPYLLVRPFLGRWLGRLRHAPRRHPQTHEPMTLLDDYDEIDHLTEGMLTEQEVRSADWDVWATADHEHLQILRYGLRYHGYDKCPECGYETYKRTHTKILRAATYSAPGRKRETYTCASCAYEHQRERVIPQKTRDSDGGGDGGSSFGGGGGGGGGGGSSYSGGGGSSGGGGAGASW